MRHVGAAATTVYRNAHFSWGHAIAQAYLMLGTHAMVQQRRRRIGRRGVGEDRSGDECSTGAPWSVRSRWRRSGGGGGGGGGRVIYDDNNNAVY